MVHVTAPGFAKLRASNSSHRQGTVFISQVRLDLNSLLSPNVSTLPASVPLAQMLEELPPYDSSSPLPGYFASRNLASPIDTTSLLSIGSEVGEYNYTSDHLHINLGPRRWGTRFPIYGFQGVVDGTVRFAKKCSHVMSVTASVSLLWSYRPLANRKLYRFDSLRGE